MRQISRALICAGLGAGLGAAALTVAAPLLAEQAPAPPSMKSMPKPYVAPDSLPDNLVLLPAAPEKQSPLAKRDRQASKAALKLMGGPRWALATADADLFGPGSSTAFSCAAGIEISATATPLTHAMMNRAAVSLAAATAPIKRNYQRARPFIVNHQPICTPDWESRLRKDGSYPSGHSAIGYGWGLILAELLPERATALIARGQAFGDSRRICNVHWLSDVEQGRVSATATLARLHGDATFRADMEAARAELATHKAPPSRDCAGEAAALSLTR